MSGEHFGEVDCVGIGVGSPELVAASNSERHPLLSRHLLQSERVVRRDCSFEVL